MKTVILIPARYASSRFPGKPLAKLRLPNGESKTLIELTWLTACKVKGISDIYIATDDKRIKEKAESFGAKVIMTSVHCANGTERCADAFRQQKIKADLIVNLQGDAPLTPEWFIEALIDRMTRDQTISVSTPVIKVDQTTYGHFKDDRKNDKVGGTTVVFDKAQNALYFSKEVLPYLNLENLRDSSNIPVFHHVGVYAYRPEGLNKYIKEKYNLLT